MAVALHIPCETNARSEFLPIRFPHIDLRVGSNVSVIGLYESGIAGVDESRRGIHKRLAADSLQETVLIKIRNVADRPANISHRKHERPAQAGGHGEARP